MQNLSPKDWAGKAAVIVGGGESFSAADSRLIGMARNKDLIRVIAVNDAVYPCWFADICYACDPEWWRHHPLPEFLGRKMRLDKNPKGIPVSDEIEVIKSAGEHGLSSRGIYTGRNGGYQALQVAFHLGATRMCLVGIDMSGGHWFGEHPKGVRRGSPLHATMSRNFDHLGPLLAKRGVEVVNASAISRIRAFPKVSLGEWLEALEA